MKRIVLIYGLLLCLALSVAAQEKVVKLKIVVIGSGLSLQNIAVIQQYQILLILFALFLHERINPCETPLPLVAGYKIIRRIRYCWITAIFCRDSPLPITIII